MTKELLLAAFLIGVGLCIAGAGTHLYQWLARQQAMLRYDGKTFVSSMGKPRRQLCLRPLHHAADGLAA